jgi:hypothetical protein
MPRTASRTSRPRPVTFAVARRIRLELKSLLEESWRCVAPKRSAESRLGKKKA